MTTARTRSSQRFSGAHPVFGRTYRTKLASGGVRETERGVPYTQSPYYLWWCALRLSDRYKIVCNNAGSVRSKVLKRLFDDFGDIHAQDFEPWWRLKGTELFAEPPSLESVQTVTANEIDHYRDLITEGEAILVAIPLNWDKRSILKGVRSQLKRIPARKRGRITREDALSKSKAKYKLQPFKSLKSIAAALKVVEQRRDNIPLKRIALQNEATSSVSRRHRMGLNIIEGVERGEFPVTRRNRTT